MCPSADPKTGLSLPDLKSLNETSVGPCRSERNTIRLPSDEAVGKKFEPASRVNAAFLRGPDLGWYRQEGSRGQSHSLGGERQSRANPRQAGLHAAADCHRVPETRSGDCHRPAGDGYAPYIFHVSGNCRKNDLLIGASRLPDLGISCARQRSAQLNTGHRSARGRTIHQQDGLLPRVVLRPEEQDALSIRRPDRRAGGKKPRGQHARWTTVGRDNENSLRVTRPDIDLVSRPVDDLLAIRRKPGRLPWVVTWRGSPPSAGTT